MVIYSIPKLYKVNPLIKPLHRMALFCLDIMWKSTESKDYIIFKEIYLKIIGELQHIVWEPYDKLHHKGIPLTEEYQITFARMITICESHFIAAENRKPY